MIALPDDLPVGVVAVPDLRPIPAAAVAALDLAGEDTDRALAVPAFGAGGHQGLHHLEGLWIDNGLMIVFDIVLRDFALVGLFLLGQEVDREGLLQQRIALVLLVCENAFDVAGVPVVLAAGRRNAFFGQRPGNLEWRLALQEHSVDALDQLGLFWVYHEVVVRPHVVAQKSLERNRDLAVCKPLPLAPCAVLGNGPGLFLRQRGHDRQQKFTLAVEGPDVFFFKIDLELRARLEDQETDYDITGLNAFISSFSVNTDLISYRYVSFKEYITLLRNTLFKRTYEYPCFLSTTLIDNLYSMDDIKYKRLLIKILIPKGTNGIILPEVNPKNPEFELLLPYRIKLQRVAVKTFMIAN